MSYTLIDNDTGKDIIETIINQKEEIERLNKKIEQYENPEDMTLMFMWCDEKAKDEIKRLNNIINELKWKPIEEYDKDNYDWVLVKYFDGDYECVPCVAEKRFGKWYSIDEKEIQFDVKYFMDMQQIDKLQELKGSAVN